LADDRKRLLLEVVALLVVVALIVTFTTRSRHAREAVYDTRIAMGTVVTVTVFGGGGKATDAVEAAFREVARVESLTTTYSPSSVVSKLNAASAAASAGAAVAHKTVARATDRDVFAIVATSLDVSEASSGAFDITIEPLTRLWRFDVTDFKLPPADSIDAALPRIDYHLVHLDIDSGEISLAEGAEINLDGVAKGYAVDRSLDVLRGMGVTRAIVDAGGDLGFVGSPPGASLWKVGIKHPRTDGLLGVIEVSGGGVATSGDYQRFRILDGMRHHHILDPSNGYPARGVLSVTVTAANTVVADALATAVFVMGPERGMAMVENMPGVEAVIVTGEENVQDVLVSSGLRDRYDDASALVGGT
jgi:FAD:protein FMN transferase